MYKVSKIQTTISTVTSNTNGLMTTCDRSRVAQIFLKLVCTIIIVAQILKGGLNFREFMVSHFKTYFPNSDIMTFACAMHTQAQNYEQLTHQTEKHFLGNKRKEPT